MRAFISYSSKDRPAVRALVEALTARGIECWWDQWFIDPGTDIVAAINRGLDEAGAGVIVFSDHSRESRWVDAETSYLTYARIQENKVLIPVMAHGDAWVPPYGYDSAETGPQAGMRSALGGWSLSLLWRVVRCLS